MIERGIITRYECSTTGNLLEVCHELRDQPWRMFWDFYLKAVKDNCFVRDVGYLTTHTTSSWSRLNPALDVNKSSGLLVMVRRRIGWDLTLVLHIFFLTLYILCERVFLMSTH
jgi:hypothetical protein